ncbi:MAG: hypothetical protein HOY79_04535 [Streptomyces sp.]|nr:hypothetical protein [Streptomyces sp.]NUS15472.1 hypothetical protein [Streptomyces sp.]NUS24069.1 hypothetical protein [Streptomyces sp.]
MPVIAWIAVAVVAVAVVGTVCARWWEKRHPSSYPQQQAALEAAGVDSMDGWHGLSTEDQEAADTASLDRAEQAALDAEAEARDAAEFQVHRLQINSLTHP